MLSIKIDNISYRKKIILKNINFQLNNNGIFGFFGKNGEGKTTFLKSFCELVKFQGSIKIDSISLLPTDVAYIPTEPKVYEYLYANEFYEFYRTIIGDKPLNKDLLFEVENKLIRDCSTGNKKKIFINSVLQFKNYPVYIFDEPFNGLDIESNYILLNHIVELSKTSIVLISSHIIEIIEPYLTKKFIIENGKVKEIENEKLLKTHFLQK
jgi:ABC-2 type transport system ATP-binding protein